MNNELIQARAEKIAARVEPGSVSFDPATIITIFSTLLPILLQCFQKNDQPNPQEINAAVKERYEANPVALRRRTARRIRGEAEQPMTRDEAFTLADAMIAEAVEASPEETAEFALACGVPE